MHIGWAKTAGVFFQKLGNTIQTRGEEITVRRVIHQFDLATQGADDRHVLGLRIGVNDADELQPMHRTRLCQPDAHVARGGFNHRIARLEPTVRQSAFDHVPRGPVLGAATGVQRLDLGDHIDIVAVEVAG